MDIFTFITQVPELAAAVIILAELIAKGIKLDGWPARIETWVISVALVYGCDYFGLTSMFVGATDTIKIISAIVIGLVANGIFTIDQVKKTLEFLKIRTAK